MDNKISGAASRALALVLLLTAACASTERMMRISPFADGDLADPDRINLWPFYYQSGSKLSVLWPFFDLDEDGFAIRPLLSKDSDSVSILGPLAGWNWEEGTWWVLPAYSLEDQQGLFPLGGLGDVNHIGPLIWDGDGEDGDDFLTLLPVFLYMRDAEEYTLLTPLGGRGWNADGETHFLNVMGPLFHRWWDEEERYTAVLWPLSSFHDQPDRIRYHVYPFFGIDRAEEEQSYWTLGGLLGLRYEGEASAWRALPLMSWSGLEEFELCEYLALVGRRAGEESSEFFALSPVGFFADVDREPERRSYSALLGLLGYTAEGETHSVRAAPLLAWSDRESRFGLLDNLTLVGYHGHEDEAEFHLLTPLGFGHERYEEGSEWSALLGTVRYQGEEETSNFSLLWYLVRAERTGDVVHRDMFPFLTWDSGPDLARFSLMYRLIHYERVGEHSRGSFLFIPLWDGLGEEDSDAAEAIPEVPDDPGS